MTKRINGQLVIDIVRSATGDPLVLFNAADLKFVGRRRYASGISGMVSVMLIVLIVLMPAMRAFADESMPIIDNAPVAEEVVSQEVSAAVETPEVAVSDDGSTPAEQGTVSTNNEQSETGESVKDGAVEAIEQATDVSAPEAPTPEVVPINTHKDIQEIAPVQSQEYIPVMQQIAGDAVEREQGDTGEDAGTNDADGSMRQQIEQEWQMRFDAYRAQLQGEVQDGVARELEQRCTKMDGVGYYCIDRQKENNGSIATSSDERPRVYYAKDAKEGDEEIFVQRGGEVRQITNNDADDLFPSYDMARNSVSWQGFVGGRWQIFVYDLRTDSLSQVTGSDFNSMNPQMRDGALVWQSWVDGNWEIVEATVTGEGAERHWDIRQITHNARHDMFPKVNGDAIVWQAYERNGWRMYYYSRASGETIRLGVDDANYEDPRFALVWDERRADGSVRRLGYDIDTGAVISFGDGTVDVPFSLPATSSGQEEVAIINGSSSGKTEEGDAYNPIDQ